MTAEKAALPVSEVNGVRIFDAAERGESHSVTCIDALVEHLSDGICNVVTVVNPEAVILGGVIMARSAYLRPRLEKALQKRLSRHCSPNFMNISVPNRDAPAFSK